MAYLVVVGRGVVEFSVVVGFVVDYFLLICIYTIQFIIINPI